MPNAATETSAKPASRDVSFDVSPADTAIITKIVARAAKINTRVGCPKLDRFSLQMDITACHANGTPLDLARLYAADDFNFSHDVFGIERWIDRRSGQLTGYFSPRFSRKMEA